VEREQQARPRERFHYEAPGEPPGADPRGPDWWDEAPPPPPRRGRVDFAALFVLLDAVRRAVPGDLQNQFTNLVREALMTLRALIDWYLERLDHPRREPEVEDIRID
jgi:hypothetical protein